MHYLENGKVYCLQHNYEEEAHACTVVVVQEHQLILLDMVEDLEEAVVDLGLEEFKLAAMVVLW